jgi:nanoRNase/pAp phosphatase (c-di-AMP/oligoRNAs hydrolase)
VKRLKKNVGDLVGFLSSNRKRLSPLLVLPHDYPDPDALASAFALWYLAEKQFGIQTRIAHRGVIGRDENKEMVRALAIPVHQLRADDLKRHRSIALVDTQPLFDNNPMPRRRRATIVVDQHDDDGEPKADFALIDVAAGATSVLLAREFLAHDIEMPRNVATALVYGILTDTLNLHRVGQSEAQEMYMALLPKCDLELLALIQNPSRPEQFFNTFAEGLLRATIHGGLIVSHLGHVESPEFVSQMADFLLTCHGMQWSFCTGRVGSNLHVSLRSATTSQRVVSLLRAVLHRIGQGGGHGRIAGGKLVVRAPLGSSKWEARERLLTTRLVKTLRMPGSSLARPLVRLEHSHNGSN